MEDEQIIFLKAALDFIPEIWEDKEKKCTQKNIAKLLDYDSSYISKAKENIGYATKVNRKILLLIRKLGGRYSKTEQTFYDKEGNPFPTGTNIKSGFSLKIQEGVDSPLFRGHMAKTKTLRILTTWAGETYDNLMRILDNEPESWAAIEKIEVLILHPNSVGTFLRSKGLGYNIERGFNRIKDELQEILNTPAEVKNKLEIRLYNELPSVNLIIMDDMTTIGFLLLKELSRKGNHIMLEHNHGSTLPHSLKKHFDKIWEGAEIFNFEKGEEILESWKHPTYKKHNKSVYQKFKGTYRLYYSERYSSQEKYRNHKVTSSIGCNILQITESKNGLFKCKMNPMAFEKGEYYEGEILNTRFNNPEYLILQLRNKHNSRYLNLSFSIKNAKKRKLHFGVFSVIYGSSGKLGSGLAVLSPSEENFEDMEPTSLDPRILATHKKGMHAPITDNKTIAYLANKKESLIFPVSHKDELPKMLLPHGTYKLYSYSQNSEDVNIKQINIAVLEILSTGMVRFKNRTSGFEGVGLARRIQSNLYIELVNSNQNINRTALFILQVGNNPSPKESIIYCGISAGTTWAEESPVASRVIMEYSPDESFEDLGAEKITLHSSRYNDLPPSIKFALSGKTSNFIGFFNKRGRIFSQATLGENSTYTMDYAKLFYKSACFDALQGDYKSSFSNLDNAVKHGFANIPKFREFLGEHGIKSNDLERGIIIIEQFLEKMKKM